MSILSWIILGLIAGFIGSKIVNKSGQGFMLDVALGIFLFLGLPATALWAIGLLLGINMLFGGWALVFMALHARPSNKTPVVAPA